MESILIKQNIKNKTKYKKKIVFIFYISYNNTIKIGSFFVNLRIHFKILCTYIHLVLNTLGESRGHSELRFKKKLIHEISISTGG